MSGQKVTKDIPVIDPREARHGRFLVSRRKWGEVCRYAEQLDAAMRARNVSLESWTVVATYHTSTHCWALYAMPAEPPGGTIDPGVTR